MASASRLLGEHLVDRKALARDQMEAALAREAETGVAFTKLVLAEGMVSERDLTGAVAEQLGFGFWDPVTVPIQPVVRGLVPERVARTHRSVAVDVGDGGELLVACGDPANRTTLDAVAQATGWTITPLLVAPSDLSRALELEYGPDPGGEAMPAVAVHPAGDAGEVSEGRLHLNALLKEMLALQASDLHLTAGRPATVRVHGAVRALDGHPPLIPSELRELVYGILSQRQRERFESHKELDTSHTVPGLGRFRVNVFQQRDSVGAVLRAIPFEIRPLRDLGIPDTVEQFATLQRGLVLVTGATGSGKSTTLAALVDMINTTRAAHIMTVEDPIEFLHEHKRCVVNQREVGVDTTSFGEALKHVLRQDPDVILVGEMRDLDTISAALTAAETGHVVFGTLHTQDAPQSVDRIIDVFPAHQQQQIRVQLASALQGIVTQQLVPTSDGAGRAVATEVLVATPAIRNLIREGKVHQIYSSMQAGGQYGMQTMDHSLADLVRRRVITLGAALERCVNPADIHRLASAAH